MTMISAVRPHKSSRDEAPPWAAQPRGAPRSTRLFGPHLPALRRYAAAISTSPSTADTLVYAALAGLVEDTAARGPGAEPRLLMFRIFHEIWSALQQIVEPPIRRVVGRDGEILETYGPSFERAALLLVTTASFSPAEAAFITGLRTTSISAIVRKWVRTAAHHGGADQAEHGGWAPA